MIDLSLRKLPLDGLDCAILVGGLGTRLRGIVDDLPKPLAPVLGRPFLFYQLDMLALRGARSVTLCCGYKAEIIREKVGLEWMGMPVNFSVEPEPLGTGGALALAREFLTSEKVFIFNGDSWLEPEWLEMLDTGGQSEICLALTRVEDAARFGTVEMDETGAVTAFREKSGDHLSGVINGGVYLLSQTALTDLAVGKHSLETEVFPALVASGKVCGVLTKSRFIDIGIPETYAVVGEFFHELGIAPHSMFPDSPEMRTALPKLGTCLLICDDHGRILLEQRSDCGWWGLPGGKLEAGETLAACARREAREETGLEVEMQALIGVFSDPRRRAVRYPDNGDLRHLIDVAVFARPVDGELARSAESLELGWFSPESLPLGMVPPVVEILRRAFAMRDTLPALC